MKTIKFVPYNEKAKLVIDPPVPSKRKIPDWFKKMPLHSFEKFGFKSPDVVNLTVKGCPAVIDMMTMGYTICLDADVLFVNPQDFNYRVIWDVSWDMASGHISEQVPEEFVPDGFESSPLKWERQSSWSIQTPPGYSLLYFHPFYRNDLPFITIPGIVDSDDYSTPINLPFFIKKDFYGVVEKGTPIAQVIPIKRENWNHHVDENIFPNSEHRMDILKSVMYQSYKKRWWNKKTYK